MSARAAAASSVHLPRSSSLAEGIRPPVMRPGLLLLGADVTAILLARYLGVTVWRLVNASVGADNQFDLWLCSALFVVVFAASGLYAASGVGPVEELRRIVLGSLLVSLVLTAAVFLSKSEEAYSRGIFLSTGALTMLIAPVNRAVIRRWFATKSWWGVRVLVLGAGQTARLLFGSLASQPALGLKPVACLDDDPNKQGECAGVPVVGPLFLAPDLARSLGVRHAIVAMPSLGHQQLLRILETCGSEFTHITVIPDLIGVGSLWVATKDLGGVLGLQIRQNLLVPLNRRLKRAIDFFIALTLGAAALPIIMAAALWIKLVSGGSPFYTQQREGVGGRPIRIRKLRTMRLDADSMLERYLDGDPQALREWHAHFKLRQDPRVLPGIGQILRRTSLDELPQLWNVLRGEMSLVGPRPFPSYHLEQFGQEFRGLRRKVTPGLTGLWQVASRSDGDLKIQESLDTYYIRNWSLWLDLHILARTVRAVLFARGAY